jgi:signal transduction histidine kinase
MQQLLDYLSGNNFMPHGHCYHWEPAVLWSYAISDSIIALAYLVIPLSLVRIVRRRKDFSYMWMVALFAVFILGCGTTHVFDVINIWEPLYTIDAGVRIITALASIGTAAMLLVITPRLILIPSAQQWKAVNEELRLLNENLEQKVQERTARLEESVARAERQNEELRRANEELDSFLYATSHDLSAPVTNLQGLLQLLSKKGTQALSEKTSPLLGMMGKQMERLSEVIHDLSEVGSVQHRAEEAAEWVDIQTVLEDFKESQQSRIRQVGAEFDAIFEVSELYFSKKLFSSVMHNLLDNALKYQADERAPVIRLKTYQENDCLVLEVKDNGSGIRPGHLSKIFGMFTRFHRTKEGTGIGLYLVKKIAEKHQGKVEVESEVNQGTTFRVYLPHQPSA